MHLPLQAMDKIYRVLFPHLKVDGFAPVFIDLISLFAKMEAVEIGFDLSILTKQNNLFLSLKESFLFQLKWTIEIQRLLNCCSSAEKQTLTIPEPVFHIEDITLFVKQIKLISSRRSRFNPFQTSATQRLPKRISHCVSLLKDDDAQINAVLRTQIREQKAQLINAWLRIGLHNQDKEFYKVASSVLCDDLFFLISDENLRLLYENFSVVHGQPKWVLDTPKISKRREGQLKLQALCQVASIDPSKVVDIKHLAFENYALKSLPENIGVLKSVETINLSNNHLEKLPDSLGELVYLRHLDIKNNQLIKFIDNIDGFTKLETIDLSNNFLSFLPLKIGRLQSLSKLFLQGNELEELPISFYRLQALCCLDLNGNSLQNLPVRFGRLSSLEILNLANNGFRRLDESVGQLINLKELSINGNKLVSLPESLSSLQHLQVLDARSNELRLFSLGKELSSLRVLRLGNNFIGLWTKEDIEVLFQQLTHTQLTELDISNNRFTDIPTTVTMLSHLQFLDVSGNAVHPSLSVDGLYSLRHLNLSKVNMGNWAPLQLDALFDGLVSMRLESLLLSGNAFRSLPQSIGHLIHLSRLELSANNIGDWNPTQRERLFSQINQLPHLQHLDLSKNRLQSLSGTFGQNPSLQKLDVSGNKLRSLPDEIEKLRHLQHLSISHNRIRTLPSLLRLHALHELDASHNELNQFPVVPSMIRTLNLERNYCGKLPEDMERLTSLESLNVNFNCLQTVPSSIGHAMNLRHLLMRGNEITLMPSQLSMLAALETLDLGGNKLRFWKPESIDVFLQSLGSLNKLRYLRFDTNPLTHEQRVLLHKKIPSKRILQ